jgi:hypothetical protein
VHDDPLTERFAAMLAGEIVIERADRFGAEDRSGQVCEGRWQDEQSLAGGTEQRRTIWGVEIGRIDSARARYRVSRFLHRFLLAD